MLQARNTYRYCNDKNSDIHIFLYNLSEMLLFCIISCYLKVNSFKLASVIWRMHHTRKNMRLWCLVLLNKLFIIKLTIKLLLALHYCGIIDYSPILLGDIILLQ